MNDPIYQANYDRATHSVMAHVAAGIDIEQAAYKASQDHDLSLSQFGKLTAEAREHIPTLIASGALKVAA